MDTGIRYKVAVVGARRNRQGTGEWIARAFHRRGHRIVGIVGTSAGSVDAARHDLLTKHGIGTDGYLCFDALLREQSPDIVAVCTPPGDHSVFVRAALAAGCHVLCEKPLVWDAASDPPARPDAMTSQVEALVSLAGRRLLELNTQWPCTLACFRELHPDHEPSSAPRRFEMWLSPVSGGAGMVVDSASHPLSMLQALCGPGRLASIQTRFSALGDTALGRLHLRFDYRHAAGVTQVECVFARCVTSPRPAGYAIDGRRAEREISMPDYGQHLVAGDRRVICPDPLVVRVDDFLDGVRAGRRTDGRALIEGQEMLCQLVMAAAAEERERA